MLFLHTSDWHVGKPLRNQKRDDEYAAALDEVLDIAKREAVDCVLVAGDVFDTAVPTPDAERIVFRFFGELAGAGIPAVVIAGNHDHPRRWNAYAPVFSHLGIHVVGEPVPADEGGVIRIASRDKSETAVVAALPWVSERKVRDFEALMLEGKHTEQYAQGVADMMRHLAGGFTKDTVNVLIAHAYVSGAVVGPEGGERPMHVGDLYAITPQAIPSEAQYVALGHVHNPDQPALKLSNGFYSGALLRCDFGEENHRRGVRMIDAKPGKPPDVEFVPLTTPKSLRNIGSHKAGVTLEELREFADGVDPEAYVKVFVKVDRPLPGLADQVREMVPNAVDIVVAQTDEKPEEGPSIDRLSPVELFTAYYEATYQAPPRPELMALFNELHEEVAGAPD